MNAYRNVSFAAVCTAAILLGGLSANAQTFEEKMTITFSAPVEIPGKVLPAGSYVFENVNQGNLTRIMSADERHLYATVLTVPENRNRSVPEQSVIVEPKKDERIPQRIDAWFIPGESIGSEFIYKEDSVNSLSSLLKHSPRKIEHLMTASARDVQHSSEFVGRHAARLSESLGITFVHAVKFVVT